MHKKLATDLTSLAHSILQMKNKEDVFALKAKAHDVYEKLALLAYVEEYINNTPNPTTNKGILLAKLAAAEKKIAEGTATIKNIEEQEIADPIEIEKKVIPLTSHFIAENNTIEEITTTPTENIAEPTLTEEVIEQPFDELENILFGETAAEEKEKEVSSIEEIADIPIIEEEEIIEPEITLFEEKEIETPEITLFEELEIEIKPEETLASKEDSTLTLEEELKDTLSVDVMANLFEKAPPKTLNDKLFQNTMKIDLNDRIAFVKNLFEGNQEDFNRVVSQLNTIKTEKEAKEFIVQMVKPDYDWSNHESYEIRLLEIIEKRFS